MSTTKREVTQHTLNWWLSPINQVSWLTLGVPDLLHLLPFLPNTRPSGKNRNFWASLMLTGLRTLSFPGENVVGTRDPSSPNCWPEPTGILHALGLFGEDLAGFVLKFKLETFWEEYTGWHNITPNSPQGTYFEDQVEKFLISILLLTWMLMMASTILVFKYLLS